MQTLSSVLTECKLPSWAAFSNFSPSSCVDKACSHRLRNEYVLCLIVVMTCYLFCWLVHYVEKLSSKPARFNDADFNSGKWISKKFKGFACVCMCEKEQTRRGYERAHKSKSTKVRGNCVGLRERNWERSSVARQRERMCGERERQRNTESVWMFVLMFMCLCVCVCLHVCCMYVCVCVCVCVCTHAHAHVRTYFDCVCDS